MDARIIIFKSDDNINLATYYENIEKYFKLEKSCSYENPIWDVPFMGDEDIN